jgi:biopolymer transport protein ExbD
LLLIFFMVTTVFRKETERNIEWPEAAATQQIDEKRQNIMYVWVEQSGQVFINDRPWTWPMSRRGRPDVG